MLNRQSISDAVDGLGWRLLLGTLRTAVPVGSFAQGTEVVAIALAACGTDADGHLRADVRADRVEMALQTLDEGRVEAVLADSRSIEIAESGLFKGNVQIDSAEISGRFEGDITVERLNVRMFPKGRPAW